MSSFVRNTIISMAAVASVSAAATLSVDPLAGIDLSTAKAVPTTCSAEQMSQIYNECLASCQDLATDAPIMCSDANIRSEIVDCAAKADACGNGKSNVVRQSQVDRLNTVCLADNEFEMAAVTLVFATPEEIRKSPEMVKQVQALTNTNIPVVPKAPVRPVGKDAKKDVYSSLPKMPVDKRVPVWEKPYAHKKNHTMETEMSMSSDEDVKMIHKKKVRTMKPEMSMSSDEDIEQPVLPVMHKHKIPHKPAHKKVRNEKKGPHHRVHAHDSEEVEQEDDEERKEQGKWFGKLRRHNRHNDDVEAGIEGDDNEDNEESPVYDGIDGEGENGDDEGAHNVEEFTWGQGDKDADKDGDADGDNDGDNDGVYEGIDGVKGGANGADFMDGTGSSNSTSGTGAGSATYDVIDPKKNSGVTFKTTNKPNSASTIVPVISAVCAFAMAAFMSL